MNMNKEGEKFYLINDIKGDGIKGHGSVLRLNFGSEIYNKIAG
jgi:hypothetical protein